MQNINHIKKGLSVLDLIAPRLTLTLGSCCAQNLHITPTASAEAAQERNDRPFTSRTGHTTSMTRTNLANNKEPTDALAAAVNLASTSTEENFASRRSVGNCRHVKSWKKMKNCSSSVIFNSADDHCQQFGSTHQWRSLSTNSTSSTDVDLQQPGDPHGISDPYNATKLSGSSAFEQKDPKTMPQPPDPETCCESGCVNCVWIRYVQELMEHSPNDKEQVKKVLDQIEDYNVKMFVKMELDL
ncbi:uncharacterized protein LOC117292721 [Asterias rubens]|uniref:uncharacterized protein LOC117292721 n=1 Tax=Asterias rubens TaxID=7604 RepID=UPI0014552B1D|nr:uncharacterized protein LOC117292721 [Asterias rubens]